MTSEFVKVACKKCKNEQIIFGKAASEVKCLVCNEVLVKSTGGKTNILANVVSKVD